MKNKVGISGIVVGLIALTAAFLSPWIVEAVSPPKPIEESLVDFALKIKDAAVAKAKGKEYRPEKKERDIGDFIPPSIIGVSMLAVILGVVSLVKDDKKIIGGTAACLGISAAVVQWSIIIAAAVIFLILVAIVLAALGIDLSF